MDGGGEETLEEEVKGGKRRNIESRYPGWALFIEREREALKCIVLTNGSLNPKPEKKKKGGEISFARGETGIRTDRHHNLVS
jgi:hypothetical protein